MYAPELDWVSKGDRFLMNDEKGDEFGLEEDDGLDEEKDVPFKMEF